MKKGGKRFEIACYKNKVGEFRSGIEKDVDEVLQISSVFTNVSKGAVAPTSELQKAFNTTSIPDIVKEILTKGELQVGEKERNHQLGNLWKEIASLVAEKCVDPNTGRPVSVGMVEKGMTEVGFNVRADKSAKIQALEAIKILSSSSSLSIQRARMRVRLTMPTKDGKRLKEKVLGLAETVEEDDMGSSEWEVIMAIDPSAFRTLNELLEAETKGKGRLESLGTIGVTKEERLE